MRKLFLLLFMVLTLSSCATANADNNQQEQVKKEVLKSLEKEYKQPFKILDFKYKQENYSNPANDCTFIYCKTTKIGVYYFKIQAVDNPIIVMDLEISDKGKESIKQSILCWSWNVL